jgi:hypothetical protein
MTAEVIVLNKSAVALAADSAVTIGQGEAGKIYNSVNKVFTLSKYRPVGVMVYANADYMGVPIETIIKMYRQRLGHKGEATVGQYARRFLTYLGSYRFASAFQQAANVSRTWGIVLEILGGDIRSSIRQEFLSKGNCPIPRQKQLISEVSEAHLDKLEGAIPFAGFGRRHPAALISRYRAGYDQALGFLPKAPNAAVEKLWERIAGLSITRRQSWYPTYTGIVVTGFGESEIFPQYVSVLDSGLAAGVHRFEIVDSDGIAHRGHSSVIVPFAQSEMVTRFMDGVDPRYEQYVAGATLGALQELADAMIKVYVPGTRTQREKTRKTIMRAISKKAGSLRTVAEQWRRDRFVDPVMEAVQNLPKEDLANLAEALVNLTSIKRRVSTERETVGGPIDVAVISKGDGFIWIKRKHYFRPEMNPQFLSNYYRAQ